MNMDDLVPVRFRVVLELTLPDADPWDPPDLDALLEQLKEAIINAPKVNCRDVMIREAENIGPTDDYEQWRGGWKYDFSSFSPNVSYLFGTSYPVAPVDPMELARVWDVLSKAEAGELGNTNIAIAIGQVLRPESDARATIARMYILRSLRARKAVTSRPSMTTFEKAATMPLETLPDTESALDSLASLFPDELR
jgi:hypothetical protein